MIRLRKIDWWLIRQRIKNRLFRIYFDVVPAPRDRRED